MKSFTNKLSREEPHLKKPHPHTPHSVYHQDIQLIFIKYSMRTHFIIREKPANFTPIPSENLGCQPTPAKFTQIDQCVKDMAHVQNMTESQPCFFWTENQTCYHI
jgi:hypothetical protein